MNTDASQPATPDDTGRPSLLTDFTEPSHNARWQVVNDNVMGGRSVGQLSFLSLAQPDVPAANPEGSREGGSAASTAPAVLRFQGFINTNGGGFASVRLPLDDHALDGAAAIRLRLQSDFRNIYLRLDDDRRHRGRDFNHRARLPLDDDASPNAWQIVTVPLDALTPAWRGNRLRGAPGFDPDHAVRLGLMLNDTQDGAFRLVIDRIEVLHAPGRGE